MAKCLKGKSEAGKKDATYKCKKCGALATAKDHVCSPAKLDDPAPAKKTKADKTDKKTKKAEKAADKLKSAEKELKKLEKKVEKARLKVEKAKAKVKTAK